MTKLAVIGAGMMGSAIVTGIVEKSVLDPKEIFLSDPDTEKVQKLCERLGTNAAASNAEAAAGADVILIAVKPQFLQSAIQNLKENISADALVMTIVAGVPVSRYLESLGVARVIRIMPNTPA